MNVENLKVLQLGKFYPIRGGVEKVAFDLMKGLSERGIECHMLCAAAYSGGYPFSISGDIRSVPS